MKKWKSKDFVKMWGEHVSLLHLVISILINIGLVLISIYATTTLAREYRLMIGLGAICLALIVNSILFKPKRNVVSK